jgi:hypothetical protein
MGLLAAAVVGPWLGGGRSSAFASAPSGLGAVFVRDEGGEDALLVAPLDNLGAPREVARIAHLPGFASRGAVAPGRRMAALVVADGGRPADPVASLWLVTLDGGASHVAARAIDVLQTPLWARDEQSVVVTVTAKADNPLTDVEVIQAGLDGQILSRLQFRQVLGAYPVGWRGDGQLLTVVIDGRGSSLWAGEREVGVFSRNITRDWAVSSDGATMAFIDVSTANGVSYRPATTATGADFAGIVPAGRGQALGTAFQPGWTVAIHGAEPRAAASSRGRGFDIPLGWSPDGVYLALESWDGASFAAPGSSRFVITDGRKRVDAPPANRFIGWVSP